MVAVAVARAGRQDESKVASSPVADASVAEQRVAVSELELADREDVAAEARLQVTDLIRIHRAGVNRRRSDGRGRSGACTKEVQGTSSGLLPGAPRIGRRVGDRNTRVEPCFRRYPWIE